MDTEAGTAPLNWIENKYEGAGYFSNEILNIE